MEPYQRVLTVFHELYFRETLERGAQDSRSARYMNMALARKPDLSTYLQALKDARSFEPKGHLPMLYKWLKVQELSDWQSVMQMGAYSIVITNRVNALDQAIYVSSVDGRPIGISLHRHIHEKARGSGVFPQEQMAKEHVIGNVTLRLKDENRSMVGNYGPNDVFNHAEHFYFLSPGNRLRFARDSDLKWAKIENRKVTGLTQFELSETGMLQPDTGFGQATDFFNRYLLEAMRGSGPLE